MLKVKKLHPDAILPTSAHETDAGYDLYALDDFTLERVGYRYQYQFVEEKTKDSVFNYVRKSGMVKQLANTAKSVKTGLAIQLPENTFGFVHNRSSMGKRGILILGGIVDAGYRGEWHVQIANVAGDEVEYIKRGDKIAQFIVIPIIKPAIVAVEELDDSDRGAKGFGSSGK